MRAIGSKPVGQAPFEFVAHARPQAEEPLARWLMRFGLGRRRQTCLFLRELLSGFGEAILRACLKIGQHLFEGEPGRLNRLAGCLIEGLFGEISKPHMHVPKCSLEQRALVCGKRQGRGLLVGHGRRLILGDGWDDEAQLAAPGHFAELARARFEPGGELGDFAGFAFAAHGFARWGWLFRRWEYCKLVARAPGEVALPQICAAFVWWDRQGFGQCAGLALLGLVRARLYLGTVLRKPRTNLVDTGDDKR